jgi:hypothetical protein
MKYSLINCNITGINYTRKYIDGIITKRLDGWGVMVKSNNHENEFPIFLDKFKGEVILGCFYDNPSVPYNALHILKLFGNKTYTITQYAGT